MQESDISPSDGRWRYRERLQRAFTRHLDDVTRAHPFTRHRRVVLTIDDADRAALTTWLDLADEFDPEQLIEAIRVAMVKRGRKAR